MTYVEAVRTLHTIGWFLYGKPSRGKREFLLNWYWSVQFKKCPGCGE